MLVELVRFVTLKLNLVVKLRHIIRVLVPLIESTGP